MKAIIILGMHRSGTSMMAQLCQCMGAYLGEENELIAAAADNPDGYFENIEISSIDNKLLQFSNREWYSLEPLKLDSNSLQIKELTERLKVCIQNLFEKSDTIAIKDPRISILLPLWEKTLKELGVVIDYIWMFRNPLEVAASLRKRNGYTRKHSLLLWVYYNLNIAKFLEGKGYLALNYRDVLETPQIFERLGRLFNRELDSDLEWKMSHIIKSNYCHSNYTFCNVQNTQNELLLEIYSALLCNRDLTVNRLSEWEKQYKEEIIEGADKYIDFSALENIKCLEEKQIIIYGAGNCGKQSAEILRHLGFHKFDFCDRDVNKHGMNFMGGKVLPITEIEGRENLLIIIAVEDKKLKKEIEQTLVYIKGVRFLSLFVLQMAFKCFTNDYSTMASKARVFSQWYEELKMRGDYIKNACKYPILVYQNGKVGSSTISKSLWYVGIENAHIHRFFFKNDIVGELILGDDQSRFMKSSNVFSLRSTEYVKAIKNEMKGKKIITMVRDPIAVDLATVFQWMGTGILDRYCAEQLKGGKDFLLIVSELMTRIQNRLFRWFEEELKELCDIDVFEYTFDREQGYTIISKDTVEILLLKTEKLPFLTDIVRNFVHNQELEILSENMGNNKEYAHIYKEVKEKLELPKEYVEYYYKDNSFMNHFYTKKEQKSFMRKWTKHVREND